MSSLFGEFYPDFMIFSTWWLLKRVGSSWGKHYSP